MTAIVTPPTIDDLPPAPLPTDTIPDFNTKAFALAAALEDFVDQTNASAAATNQNATATDERAVTADAAAVAAVAAAASAINAPGTTATSTTSLALSTGTKNLTLAQTGKAFGLGQQIKLSRNAAPTTRMFGTLTAFNSGTGAMTVDVTSIEGAGGPYTDWDVALGVAVVPSVNPADLTRVARTSNTIITGADKGKWFDVTSGTFTQTSDNAATLAAGFWCELGNSGSGVVTFGTLNIYQGQRYRLHSDGTTIRTTALADQGVMIVRDEKPAGTNGGTGSATWAIRTLNTVSINTISGASLASNQITLPAGVYMVSARVPSATADFHKARLWNVTATAVAIVGSAGNLGNAGTKPQIDSHINGPLTFATTGVVRIEHYVNASYGTTDYGAPYSISSLVEVYSEITIRKVG